MFRFLRVHVQKVDLFRLKFSITAYSRLIIYGNIYMKPYSWVSYQW